MRSEVVEIKRTSLVGFAKYFIYFGLFFLLFKARVMGVYQPCFYGVMVALALLNENIFCLGLGYMSALVINDASTFSIILGIACVVISELCAYICKIKQRRPSFWVGLTCGAMIGVIYLYFGLQDLERIYIRAIDVVLNIISMICALNILKVLRARKFNLNLNVDEIVCGCYLLMLIFCGVQNVNVIAFDFVKLLGFLLVMFGSVLLPSGFNVILGVIGGLGAYLCGGNLEYITLFSVVAVVSFCFKDINRIYNALAVLVSDIALNLLLNLFGGVSIWTFMPTLIACIIFIAMPKSTMSKAKKLFFVKKENDTLKNILNQNKLQASKKLMYTAEVFYEMDKSFRKLAKGGLDSKSAKTMLCSEVIRENCENCPNKTKCLKGFNNELKKIFDDLINAGFEKGKITLVDLPQYLTMRCQKLNQVVSSINSLLSDYKSYAKLNQDLDSSKLLIAEQLKGVSHVLNELGKETSQIVQLDHSFEKKIIESLTYIDIVPSEVVCFEKDEKTNVVSMMIRTIDFDNEKILKVLNTFCPNKMVLDEVVPSQDNNMTYISYKTAPTYDVAVGVAKMTKGGSENSGDTHSMVKLSSGKFMVALCDGMGSGDKANKKSETSINLIENFYRAGYDDETILSCVNNLLNLTSENVFTALDLSIIDLKNGEADFIKQGATVGFIKKGEEVSKIESNSLPLGILQNISPKVTKTVLSPDEMLIMMSDGIVDALGEENLEEYLKCVNFKSPQEMADNILNKAKVVQKNYPNDDMTVLVSKLFYNCA